jgi:hypothetical protein
MATPWQRGFEPRVTVLVNRRCFLTSIPRYNLPGTRQSGSRPREDPLALFDLWEYMTCLSQAIALVPVGGMLAIQPHPTNAGSNPCQPF